LFRLRPWQPRLGGLKISAIKELRVWASDAGRTVGEMIRLGAWLDGLGLGPARSEDEFEAATTRWRMFRHECVSEPEEIGSGLFSAEAQRTWQRGATLSHKLAGRVKPFAQRMHLESVPPRDELLEIAAKLRPRVGSFFRWFNGDYRAASAAINRFWQPDFPAPVALRLQTIEQYITLLDELAKFAEDVGLRRTFGATFVGVGTDWQRLKLQIGWVAMARKQGLDHAAVMRIFESIANNTASHTTDDLTTATERFASQFADPDRVALLGGNAESVARASMVELGRRIDQLATALAEIDTVAGCFSTLRSGLVNDAIRLATLTCETAERRQMIRQNAEWPETLGRWFDATQTDWRTIRDECDAIDASVAAGLGEAELAELICDMPADAAIGKLSEFVGRLRRITDLRGQWDGHRRRLGDFGELDDSWLAWDSGHDSPGGLSGSVSHLLDRAEDVAPWASFMMLIGQCRAAGLSPIVDAMLRGLAPDRMADTYRLTVLQRVADHEVSLEPCLSQFSRQTIEAARASFQRSDRQSQVLNRDLVAHEVARRQAPSGVTRGRVRELTEMGLISHEIQKQTRFCRVRDLMRRAGRSVQALKPCFMMSPLSVAQFIDPTSLKFDLVIMDEASQIRPEDALGALMRADQMVVVGDPKQLPPTSFFDFGGDEVDDDEATIVDNTESILEVAMKTCQPVRRLRWHYRSRHENLIAFSNDRFYDGDLIVFPSPTNRSGLLGVSLEFVEGGVFKDRRNLPEAVAVADAVIRHAIEFPGESLGIGTFNISQAELIADLIDKRCGSDPQAREAIDAISGEHEPLFIKNLENLQGDERDVIFISYTYGPDAASGRVFNRFGPINSDGGWRRLNVMVTRARSRVRVFASFRPEDINVGPQSSRGVVAFRDYLRFAQTGRLPEQAIMTGKAPDSPFEVAVARVVESMGLQAVPQVGVAGYFIDIGVRHPDSGDFILGIECDGATYHSSLSARDRDRLREEVIRSRGWNLHRIWSTDWFWQQGFEIERLRAAITASLKGSDIADR